MGALKDLADRSIAGQTTAEGALVVRLAEEVERLGERVRELEAARPKSLRIAPGEKLPPLADERAR